MRPRHGWLVLALLGACTPLRPLDAEPDAGRGPIDAGRDAAPGIDASESDAPGLDAGQPDAGLDAGVAPDAGHDAPAHDAWAPPDAWLPDTGCRPGPGMRIDDCNARDDDCDGLVDEAGACRGLEPCYAETFRGHTYQFCNGRIPIDSAFIQCEAWGYHLVHLETAEENAWVATTAVGHGLGTGMGLGQTVTAIGLRRTIGLEFEWSDGAPTTFASWDVGEPDGDQDCARIRSTAGGWSDCACSELHDFVCETP